MRYTRTALLCAGVLALPLALAAGATAAPPARGGMVPYDAAGTPVAVLTPLTGAAQVTGDAQVTGAAQVTDAAQAADPGLQMLREMESAMDTPFDGGLQQLIAAQEASMRGMEHEMQVATQSMAPVFRGPGQTIEVAMPPAGNGEVTGTYVWSIASGQGQCAETVTFTYSGDGRAPQLVQRKTGKVCGKHDLGKSGSMPATIEPSPPSNRPRLLEVSTPAQAPDPLHG